MKAAKPDDIIATFGETDLLRATHLREFVKEQYAGASVKRVNHLIELALQSRDTVVQALHLRYAKLGRLCRRVA